MKIETHEIQRRNRRAIEISPSVEKRRAIFSCVFLILILPATLYCKTFAEYRDAVKNAAALTAALTAADEEELSASEIREYEREAVAEIRAALPASGERIEWQGATIETDYRWLHERLDQFEKETANAPKRAALLTEIDGRLGAVARKLDELETSAAAASGRTKDEDKQKLSEILRRAEYGKPEEKQESFFARTWRRFREWLREKFSQPDIPDVPSTSGFQSLSLVLQMLLYALILGAVGFVVYRFTPFFLGKFKARERREKRERVILGERIAANETAENLFAEAERMARSGDLRGAIRKGYVALLCDLSDRGIIGLARSKTNRDYLRDVRPTPDLYENMRGLTANFERHWYGFDAVEEKDWEEFKNGYGRAIKN